jgi:aspartate-semialdehyde dehydrogenase
VLLHPQFTLSILDPTSLLGIETAAALSQAFPSARRRLFHTSGEEEHLVTEIAGEAVLVPPLSDGEELDGSDVVVATASPAPAAAARLLDWLRANPGAVLIDATQPGIAPDESVPAFNVPPVARRERRWIHLADPALWGPGRLIEALLPLRPLELQLTVLLPVSSFGEAGVEELARQAAGRLSGQSPRKLETLPAVLAFDLAPASAARRALLETQLTALFPELAYRLNAIEAGVFHGNAAVVAIRCGEAVTASKLTGLVRGQPAIRLARRNELAQPSHVVGSDEVLCADLSISGGWVTAWIVADGLRVGGAQAIADILAVVRAS